MNATRAAIGTIGAIAALLTPRLARAQATTTSVPITISGEVRTRTEGDWPGGAVRSDVYTYLRSRLGIAAEPATGVRIVLQVQDSRVFGAEGNATASNPDLLELHQGYLELGTAWGSRKLLVRAGRQIVAFGNERLVGAVDWTNTARSFDGARVLLTPEGAKAGAERWTMTAFVATTEARDRKFAALTSSGTAAAPAPDHAVAGLLATRALEAGALEATVMYDGGGHYRLYDHADRSTFDVRLRDGSGRALGVDLEAAWQGGSQHYQQSATAPVVVQDVSAWLLGARLTRPAAAGRRVTGTLGVDVLSGDANPADGTYGAFNTMYATNHPFYGQMDLFTDPAARTNDRGLIDALATTALSLPPRTTLKVELHRFAPQAGDHAEIGWEADVIAPVQLSRVATMELGYTAFRASAAAAGMGLGANGAWRHWAYLQMKAAF